MKRMLFGMLAGAFAFLNAAEIKIDFDSAKGRMKPMHGVGQPPMTGALAGYANTELSMNEWLPRWSTPGPRLRYCASARFVWHRDIRQGTTRVKYRRITVVTK